MMYILFNDMLQLQFFLTFSSLLFPPSAKDAIGELRVCSFGVIRVRITPKEHTHNSDEVKIYDDAFKNYLSVKSIRW